MSKVLLISLDAVSDNDFENLSQFPNFKKYVKNAAMVREVKSVFLTNTYPIHTSVMTGVMPCEHGIISNTKIEPHEKKPHWKFYAKDMKVKPMWDLAKERGLTTAGVMWPVSAGAKGIDYNIPEIFARDDENQIMLSLKNGSKLLQIKQVLRHGKNVKGKNLIELDKFSSSSICDLIREKSPDFTFVHLICYDGALHTDGKNSEKSKEAMQVLDECLGKMMNAVDEDTAVIIFSDHGQLDIHTNVNTNKFLSKYGVLSMDENENLISYKGFLESVGGSAFFVNNGLSLNQLEELKLGITKQDWFNRFLTHEEMKNSGYNDFEFGVCAKVGFQFHNHDSGEKGNHGYPNDYDNYRVFYGINSKNANAGISLKGGNLLDLTALIANELKINAPQIKGKISREIYR